MIQPEPLTTWLGDTYSLGSHISTELLRAYSNDVFLIHAGDQRYVFKIYKAHGRTESDIRYELDLLDHLTHKGVRVAKAIPGKDGQTLYRLPAALGEYPAALFEYADGHKPELPFTEELYVSFGRAIAAMHNAANDFTTTYHRPGLDLAFLLDEPLKLALPLIEAETDRQFLREIAGKISDKLADLSAHGLDWGAIHGDATLDNLHITDDGHIILYDFDSGGHGWRAADLQGWAENNLEYADRWVAFKQGYASLREIKAADLEAAPYLAVAWLIWGMQIDLENRVLGQGDEQIRAYLRAAVDAVRQQAQLAIK